mmetsp:Transcript_94129/g.304573  ORF Transcript_94129/g.304573 Transcript_94129/m.304573 type:complete len:214 (+) Transcript_94129:865-1506(+)
MLRTTRFHRSSNSSALNSWRCLKMKSVSCTSRRLFSTRAFSPRIPAICAADNLERENSGFRPRNVLMRAACTFLKPSTPRLKMSQMRRMNTTCSSTRACSSSTYCPAVRPTREGLPRTSMGKQPRLDRSWTSLSFSATASTAWLQTQVTRAAEASGKWAESAWKIVVLLPVPGGPWMTSTLCVSAWIASNWSSLIGMTFLCSLASRDLRVRVT